MWIIAVGIAWVAVIVVMCLFFKACENLDEPWRKDERG